MTKDRALKQEIRARMAETGESYAVARRRITQAGCLYCEDTTRKRTSEHVLQKGFGSDLTLPDDVCTDCNSVVFSPLDKMLIEFVRLYAYATHPDVIGGRTLLQDGHSLWLDDEGVWLTVRIDRDGRPIVFTQLVFLADDRVHVTLDNSKPPVDIEAELARVKAELADLARLELKPVIHTVASDDDRPKVQPALVRSAPFVYQLRAASTEEADALRARVLAGTAFANPRIQGQPEARSHQVKVEKRVEINMGGIARAVAKTALNFVCRALGPHVARRAEFDELRAFALGNKPPGDFERFVSLLPADAGLDQLAEPGRHTLMLSVADRPLVMLSLYGRPFAVVRLTQEPSMVLSRDALVAASFDYKNKTSEILRLADDPLAFARRFRFRFVR
jgi:hypothetical protein